MDRITVFKGDGIGPEITDVVLEILEAAGAQLEYEIFRVGNQEYLDNGALISDAAYASFERSKVLLKSPITTPIGTGFRSLNVTMREKYDLYANIRPAKSNHAVKTPFPDVDIVVFRENTEDLYVGDEKWLDDDTVIAKKIITRKASERIIREAFEYARVHERKLVTCVHKANILKMTDGFFLSLFNQIKEEYPEIRTNDRIIDATAMQLVMNPQQFDVMVMPNLYGDIISDLISGLIGGLGLLPSGNLGKDYAMFEAVHGSAPDIAGKGIANPTALLWSACMMLEHLKQLEPAARIRRAVDKALTNPDVVTPDLHGRGNTESYKNAIIRLLD